MVTYNFYLKIVVTLSVKNNITEFQIRDYLTDVKPKLDTRLNALIGSAPPIAQATLDNIDISLRVHKISPGLWTIYPKMILTITVADEITEIQVRNYLEDYWDQVKIDFRTLIGNVPNQAKVKIIEWHIHRLSGSVDEDEI